MTGTKRDTGAGAAAEASGRELVATRVFDAPRALVFRAWTTPEHVGRWWGPRGFTTTTYAMDVKPGGVWRYCMHGPDGADYQNKVTYVEVDDPERIVYDHDGGDDDVDPVRFRATVTFEDLGGKTRLTKRMVFPTAEARDQTVEKYGAAEGLGQTLDRLKEYVDGAGEPGRKTLVLTRTFRAPRALVFKAWTDPAQVGRWWGPHHFTNVVRAWEARPGGAIDLDMVGDDGTVYPMKGGFREVDEPDRLVFHTTAMPDEAGVPGLEVRNTVRFSGSGGSTTLTLEAVVLKATPAMATAVAGMEIGWTQSLERLETEVSHATEGGPVGREFVVSRQFQAPRELVFRAWTEADRLARWFGPKGFTTASSSLDLKPGGVYHYRMRAPDGKEMWGKWVFREVAAPERIAFVISFSDENGGVTRHPFAPDWPREVLSTISFHEFQGGTLLTIRGRPIDANEAEHRAFDAGHDSMRQGWAGTLDRLADDLAKS